MCCESKKNTFCDEMYKWQIETFDAGPHNIIPPLKHLKKELDKEIIETAEEGKMPARTSVFI